MGNFGKITKQIEDNKKHKKFSFKISSKPLPLKNPEVN